MQKTITRSLAALAALFLSALCLASGGSQAPELTELAESELTAEQQANVFYNEGLGYRNASWKMTKKLAEMPEAKREKAQKKIRGNYERAAELFAKAVQNHPSHYKALSALGYAKRKLGDFETALQAYDAALAINPDYGNAIEYRGEAYLGLGRINEAQNAYRILTEKDLTLAAELLGSMQAWIEARRTAPEGISAAQLDGFAGWVADRELTATGSTRHKGSW